MTGRGLGAVALSVVLAITAGGCNAPSERRLTVFAAASLARVFQTLGEQFENSHPGIAVVFTFDGSSGLVDQLKGGAPADVLAVADRRSMARAVDAALVVGTPTIFARNVLTLVVPPGNPGRITGLDSSLAGRRLVVCDPAVPCGAATAKLAERSGVTLDPVSAESTVTDVLGKVISGEADVGIVYVTDARAAGGKVQAVTTPGAREVVNDYPLSVLARAREPGPAREFVGLVTGPAGRDALAGAGFALP